eukprot:evm.model.scf_2101.1 EVM.evm.TU.scf_2101.1   scf_2101:8396-14474(-)
MPVDRSLSDLQSIAYKNCLRVLSAQKSDWSKHKLLSGLRKTLKIPHDAHLKYLEEVLADPEIKELSRGLAAARAAAEIPAAQSTATAPPKGRRRSLPVVPEPAPDTPKARRPPKKVARQPPKVLKAPPAPEIDASGSDDDTNTSASSAGTPASNISGLHIHQMSASGVNSLIGHHVESFWEDNDPQWVQAVVTDYKPHTREHCLTYDYGTDKESWEWADLAKEIRNGRVQLLSTTVDLDGSDNVVPQKATKNRSCRKPMGKRSLAPPYETSFFSDKLATGSLAELEDLLEGVVKRQKVVLGQLLVEGEAAGRPAGAGRSSTLWTDGRTDAMVQALAQRERLERRSEEIKSQLALHAGMGD